MERGPTRIDNLIGISSEGIDVRLDPRNGHSLIENTVVSFDIVRSVARCEKPKDTLETL